AMQPWRPARREGAIRIDRRALADRDPYPAFRRVHRPREITSAGAAAARLVENLLVPPACRRGVPAAWLHVSSTAPRRTAFPPRWPVPYREPVRGSGAPAWEAYE